MKLHCDAQIESAASDVDEAGCRFSWGFVRVVWGKVYAWATATNGGIAACVRADVECDEPGTALIPRDIFPRPDERWKCLKKPIVERDKKNWYGPHGRFIPVGEEVTDQQSIKFPDVSSVLSKAPANAIVIGISAKHLLSLAEAMSERGKGDEVEIIIDPDDPEGTLRVLPYGGRNFGVMNQVIAEEVAGMSARNWAIKRWDEEVESYTRVVRMQESEQKA